MITKKTIRAIEKEILGLGAERPSKKLIKKFRKSLKGKGEQKISEILKKVADPLLPKNKIVEIVELGANLYFPKNLPKIAHKIASLSREAFKEKKAV